MGNTQIRSKNRYGKPPYDVIKMNMCGDVIGTTGTTQNGGRKGTFITTNVSPTVTASFKLLKIYTLSILFHSNP